MKTPEEIKKGLEIAVRKNAMDTLNALLQGKVLALDENGRVAVNQMNVETLLESKRKQRKNAGGD